MKKKERIQEQLDEVLQIALAETTLPLRTCNMLEEAHILTVEDLLNTTEHQLLQIPNFGQKTLRQCFSALAKLGLHKTQPESEPEPEIESEAEPEVESRRADPDPRIQRVRKLKRKKTKDLRRLLSETFSAATASLLATGGILTVEDVIDAPQETLLFLLGQDGAPNADVGERYRVAKKIIKGLGFNLRGPS